MSFSIVIPARYASTRLPGKPLLDIAGRPMVQRVWEQACRSAAQEVIIATDDQRIAKSAEAFGARVCMTAASHPSGTDRLQEVAAKCGFADEHIIVNVQGDEPLIPPVVIDQVAANLAANPQAAMATLCEGITEVATLLDPSVVKVVRDRHDQALYFSRAPIPWPRDAFAGSRAAMPSGAHWFRHIGIYAYRSGFLHQFVDWVPAPLEETEKLEQLRALHNAQVIHVATAMEAVPGGVDTAQDLEAVRAVFARP